MTIESVVLVIASAQAFLLAGLTFQRHRALYANRFMSMMMLVVGIAVIHMLVQDNGFYDRHQGLLYIVLGILFVVEPLHFLYTKYLLSRAERFDVRDVVHFLPAVVVEVLVVLFVFLYPKTVSVPATHNAALVPAWLRIYNWLIVAFGIAYALTTLGVLRRYQKTAKNIVSSLEEVRLNWLMYLSVAGIAVWIIFLTENTLLAFGINLSNFVLTSVCGGIYVYAIGYYGLLKSEVFAAPGVGTTMQEIFEAAVGESAPAGKYTRSGLDQQTITLLAGKLAHLMDEKKPYTDSSLTLTKLAAMLSISPHNLSEVINTQFGKNFYDFVNGYRIEQVKCDLSDPAKSNLKILSIAFDAGFNSKASFNSIFKASAGTTPSEYRRQAAGPLRRTPGISD